MASTKKVANNTAANSKKVANNTAANSKKVAKKTVVNSKKVDNKLVASSKKVETAKTVASRLQRKKLPPLQTARSMSLAYRVSTMTVLNVVIAGGAIR